MLRKFKETTVYTPIKFAVLYCYQSVFPAAFIKIYAIPAAAYNKGRPQIEYDLY